MNETSSDEQGAPAGETPQEVQRSLTWTLIEGYAAVKAVDKTLEVVVPDAYAGIKDGIKKGVDKIRDREPKADPPAQDNDSAELVTPSKRIAARASYI